MSATAQNIEIDTSEDVTIELQMTPASTDISGWAMTFTMKDNDGNVKITKTVGAGITAVAGQPGWADCVIETALTGLTPGNYPYDWWRTDTGHLRRLAFGIIHFDPKVKV